MVANAAKDEVEVVTHGHLTPYLVRLDDGSWPMRHNQGLGGIVEGASYEAKQGRLAVDGWGAGPFGRF
jgi:hypothetical protein